MEPQTVIETRLYHRHGRYMAVYATNLGHLLKVGTGEEFDPTRPQWHLVHSYSIPPVEVANAADIRALTRSQLLGGRN